MNRIVKLALEIQESKTKDILTGLFSFLTGDETKKARSLAVLADRAGQKADEYVASSDSDSVLTATESSELNMMRYIFIKDVMGPDAARSFSRGVGASRGELDSLCDKYDVDTIDAWAFILGPSAVRLLDDGLTARAKMALFTMISYALENPGTTIDPFEMAMNCKMIAERSSSTDSAEDEADGSFGLSSIVNWARGIFDDTYDNNSDKAVKKVIAASPESDIAIGRQSENFRISLKDASTAVRIARKFFK